MPTSLPFVTLRQSGTTQRPTTLVTAITTSRPTSTPVWAKLTPRTTKRPSLISMTMALDPSRERSKMPVTSLLNKVKTVIES